MSIDATSKLLLGNAYRIFFDEVKKHIEVARQSLGPAASTMTTDELKALGARFHTIKGGAGFFRLTQVADGAGLLEELLLKSANDLSSETERLIKAKQVFAELENTCLTLPLPASKKVDAQ